jgi:hypothetical protein
MQAMSLRLRLWIVECQACIVAAGPSSPEEAALYGLTWPTVADSLRLRPAASDGVGHELLTGQIPLPDLAV